MKEDKANIVAIEDHYIMVVLSEKKVILFNDTHSFEQENPFGSVQDI